MEQISASLIECIRLSGAGAKGTLINDTSVAWQEVVRIAAVQNVVPLVSCALLNNPDLSCPAQVKDHLLDLMRSASAANVIRRQRMLHLIHEIEQIGVPVQVLKGYSISRLYAYPESRESVDNDILINAEDEAKVYDFLYEKGFTVKGRRPTANDGVCEHKKYGKIEVHVSLYPEITLAAWGNLIDENEFVREAPYRVTDIDGSYSTLGHTDQLLFLSLHMAKHFIESGLTIRMILDIALHFAMYKDEIDTEHYWNVIRKLKFEKLMNSILGIAVECCGFSREDFPGMLESESTQIEGVLHDLEEGGYMGALEMKERHESGMAYNRRLLLKSKSPIQYKVYMMTWKIRSGVKDMFPSYSHLKQLYPCVDKKPLLAPVLWIYQLYSYPISKLKSGVLKQEIQNDHSKIHELSEKRLQLFEKLEMF